MRELTAFQRDLLFVIAGLDEPKGLDIKDVLEEYYRNEIRHGRLYPNLDSLVSKALVEKGKHDQRTNKYELTDRGKQELRSRIAWELQMLPDSLKNEIRPLTKEA